MYECQSGKTLLHEVALSDEGVVAPFFPSKILDIQIEER